jgi:hypothetical protein
MRIKKEFIILFFLFLFIIPLVISPPDFKIQSITSTDGLTINYPEQNILRQNADFRFNFHVFNTSNGLPINVTTLNCFFHLYNASGKHIYVQNTFVVDRNWDAQVVINGANFSRLGEYSYIFQCNNSWRGGFIDTAVIVTRNGQYIETPETIINLSLFIIMFLIFLGCLYSAVVIPYSNQTGNNGEILFLTKTKYYKIGAIMLSYALFTYILNLAVSLSYNYIYIDIYYNLFSFLFNIFIGLLIPFTFLIIIWSGIALILDFNYKKRIQDMYGALK